MKVVLSGKSFMGFDRVCANPDNECPFGFELGQPARKGDRLVRSAFRPVLRVEEENHPVTPKIRQRPFFPADTLKAEFESPRTYFQHCSFLLESQCQSRCRSDVDWMPVFFESPMQSGFPWRSTTQCSVATFPWTSE